MAKTLDDTLYNLSLDVIEHGITNIEFIKKRLKCSDKNANKILKELQDLGIIGDYKFEVFGNGYEVLMQISDFRKKFKSKWEELGFPRGV